METDERLPLSYIAQYGYCPRRAGLIMNQQLWQDNEYTAEGAFQHQRAHDHRVERRGQNLLFYEFPVFSDALGLLGKCDCIEAAASPNGAALPGEALRYALYPVEYKHGPLRKEPEYEQQLCAQALCLEEMYGAVIPEGALYYIRSHRRQAIPFTPALREATRQTVLRLHELWRQGGLPPPQPGARCGKCSMKEHCQPELPASAGGYRQKLLRELAAPPKTEEGSEG